MKKYTSLIVTIGFGSLLGLSTINLITTNEPKEPENKAKCIDFRDNETFSYNVDKTYFVTGQFTKNDLCFGVVDDDGSSRVLCQSHLQTFLKCSANKGLI